MSGRASFLSSASADEGMEIANNAFWTALIDRIEEDHPGGGLDSLLDIGCHRGGFLARVAPRWRAARVVGIEPVASLRRVAEQRLRATGLSADLLAPEDWGRVPAQSVALVTGQEVLYLIEDTLRLFSDVARVLRPGGRAYFTLGSHTENPLWPAWRAILTDIGHRVFDHAPMALMAAAESAGLWPSVRPLRTDGWIVYSPATAQFPAPTVTALTDHHFRHKLLFRFEARR